MHDSEHESELDSKTKEKYLKAFRTITMMLSSMQSQSQASIESTTRPEIAKKDRNDLKLLDALSTILIRRHEIVAVVAKPFDGSKLQVIASVAHPSNTELFSQPDDDQRFWSRFITAANPRLDKIHKRDDSLINSTSTPLIRPDDISENLRTAAHSHGTSRLLKIFLETEW